MLRLPKSINIKRAKQAEASLLSRSREWLEREKRDPRIHVSDLLDPRQAYWRRVKPKPINDRLVSMFLIGKVLHAIVLSVVDGKNGIDFTSDQGEKYSKDLKIVYSQDHDLKGVPRELKTTRSWYEPKTLEDLALYCEQLLCYMIAEGVKKGQLWLKMLNLKDKRTGRTAPAYRCYTVTISDQDFEQFKRGIQDARATLERALKEKKPRLLPLCRGWKCSEIDCEWWKECKPEGRFGVKRPSKGWPETNLVCKPGKRNEACSA